MNGNEQALVERPPMSAVEIRNQVNIIQEIMKEVMQGPSKDNPEGIHYGTIPGCGQKYVLKKPGAEKLYVTFWLRPIIDPDKDVKILELGDGHREVTVYTHVYDRSGIEIATGVGSCSTKETKYRYRGGQKISTGRHVPIEYWNLKKEEKIKEAQDTIGGAGFGVMKGDNGWEICELGEKMENPDIADTYNTVLKMAKKRSYVDGALSSTATSDIFTQDMDMDEVDESHNAGTTKKGPQEPKSEPSAKQELNSEINIFENVSVSQVYEQKTKTGKEMFNIEIDGKNYSTFSASHKKIAVEARDKRLLVTIQYKVNGNFLNLSDIKLIGEEQGDGQE